MADELFESYTAVADAMKGFIRKNVARTVKFTTYIGRDTVEHFGIVRNQRIRDTAPHLQDNIVEKASKALEQHPDMFTTCRLTRDHKAPYHISPNQIIQGKFHQGTVLAAARNNLIISAVDETTDTAYRPDDIDDLQAAYDNFPEFFHTTPVNMYHCRQDYNLEVKEIGNIEKWNSMNITCLMFKNLVMAAHITDDTHKYLDIAQVKRVLEYGGNITDKTRTASDRILDIFPYLY